MGSLRLRALAVGFALCPLARAEITREQCKIQRLIEDSAKSASELENRRQISRRLLLETRNLVETSSTPTLYHWLNLRDEPFAYPELRALAREAISRIRAHLVITEGPLRNSLSYVDQLRSRPTLTDEENFAADVYSTTDTLYVAALLQALGPHSRKRLIDRTLELYHADSHPVLRRAAAESLATVQVYVPQLTRALAERATQTEDIAEIRFLALGIVNQCRLGLTSGT